MNTIHASGKELGDKSSSSNTANAYTNTRLKGRILRGERERNRFYNALVFCHVASPKLLGEFGDICVKG